jgi:SAM-dependent methyltransferase
MNKDGKLWLNVASSDYVLRDFINLDNHLFLPFINLYQNAKWLFPKKYHAIFEKYCTAKKIATIVKHDCRKRLPFEDNSVDHIVCSHFLEHVFPDEMELIVKDFYRVLEKGGTLHIIVPDIEVQIHAYLKRKNEGMALAADEFIKGTILSKENRGSLKYRLMELNGGFGLQHRWMYDKASMESKIKTMGFSLLTTNDTPSKSYRENDDSVHVVCIK